MGILLYKPNGDLLGNINGLKPETCQITHVLTDMYELTFEVSKYIDINGELVQSDWYDSLNEKMQLFVDSENEEDNIMFIINAEPTISNDGMTETKTITAHSRECELQNLYLRLFHINQGTKVSLERFEENIDSYTNLPKEYISLVNFDNPNLSLLHLALEKTEWTVDEKLKEFELDKCNKKYSFAIDEKDIYSFLMNDVAQTAKVIFEFNKKERIVSFKSIENLGEDTGIYIGLRNLVENFDVNSTSESNIITKYKPNGQNGLDISLVNFGDSYIYDMDYFVNTLNEYDDYKFVSKEFREEYLQWKELRESKRKEYISLTKQYNKNILAIDELTNRLPNDGCKIDYTTYTAEELKINHTAFTQALTALITLYKNEYPDIYTNGKNLDEEHLKTTIYWHDYYAYLYKIIPSVEEAMKMYYKTENGYLITNDNGDFILCDNGGNPEYNHNTDIVKTIDSYLYEFSLYGLTELKTKKKSWLESASILYRKGFIKNDDIDGYEENPIYITENDWNLLTSEEKSQFLGESDFKKSLNTYLDYVSFDNTRMNNLTKKVGKGVIRQCEDAIIERTNEINNYTILNNGSDGNGGIQKERKDLVDLVSIENNFSKENIKIFNLLTSEATYSNENILITSLDDIVSMIDVEEELYKDSIEELSKVSQPQYSFSSSIDNLFEIEDLKPLRQDFKVGNYIYLQTDNNKYQKLRIIKISRNPLCFTSDIIVEFSTMTKSLSGISDCSSLLGKTSSSSSNGSSSSSGSGEFGTNDAKINISNNMLNALLNTETFGTKVTDVILDSIKANKGNFNSLFAKSGVLDNVIVNGDAVIGGLLKSENYNDLNHIGSMIDLEDGSFSLGNGSLVYDIENGFSIKGLSAEDLKLKSIVNIEKYYLTTDKETGITKDSQGWSKEMQTMDAQNKFLWTYEVINYTDNTSSTTTAYIIGRYGTDGANGKDGKDAINVSSIETEYYVSTSNTSCVNGSWGKTYTWSKNKHLWTRNKIIWENNTVSYSEPQYSKYLTEYNMFQDAIVNGTTTINGGCIKTGILSSEDKRTWINLKDGQFSFGDGALTWDGNELIIGSINNKISTLETTLGGVSNTANTANNTANTAYNTANSASGKADNAYNIANEANNKAGSAYSTANNASQNLYTLQTGLTNGTTSIHGGCIKTGNLISNNYNGNDSNVFGNTAGSIISLNDGKFNLGGGALKWDGNELTINGYAKSEDVTTIATNAITTAKISCNQIESGTLTLGGSKYKSADITLLNDKDHKLGIWDKNGLYVKSDYSDDILDYVQYSEGFLGVVDKITFQNKKSYEIWNLFHKKFSTDFVTNLNTYKYYGDVILHSGTLRFYFITDKIFDEYSYFNLYVYGINENNGDDISKTVKIYSYNKVKKCFPDNISLNDEAYELLEMNPYAYYIDIDLASVLDEVKKSLNFSIETTNISFLCIRNISCSEDVQNVCCKMFDLNYHYIPNLHGAYSNADELLKYIYPEEIIKFDDVFDKNEVIQSYGNSMIIDTKNRTIKSGSIILKQNKLELNFDSSIVGNGGLNGQMFELSVYNFCHLGVYNNTTTSSSNVRIAKDGYFYRYSSSSRRYKKDIIQDIKEGLNPHKLYDINVYQFKYKDDYLDKEDDRYGQDIVGFIAEDLYEKYPLVCDLADGIPEAPNYNLMIAPMLKLIQEQHEDIELLKKEIIEIKEKINYGTE